MGLFKSTHGKLRYSRVALVPIAAFMALIIAALSLSVRSGVELTQRNVLLMHIIMEVKHDATSFHLWLEEFVQNDTSISRDELLGYLERALKTSSIMLEGGSYMGESLSAIKEPELRRHVKMLRLALQDLYSVGKARMTLVGDVAPGSIQDQHFDAIFEAVLNYSSQAESSLRSTIAQELHDYRMFSVNLGVLLVLSALLVALLYFHYEQRRRKYIMQLQMSEERTRTILNTVAEGIITFDNIGRVELFNPAVENMFAYEGSELTGLNVNNLLCEPAGSGYEKFLDRYTDPVAAEQFGKTIDLVGMKKSMATFPAETTVNSMQLDGKQYYTASISDITERRRIENALENYNRNLERRIAERTHELANAKEEAEQANNAKSAFLSSMSHELRTPLNAILGFAQLLNLKEKDQLLTQPDVECVQEILDAGGHLLELVNDVLDLSKIEAGHLEISAEDCSLREVLTQCITMMQAVADEKHIIITSSLAEDEDYDVYIDIRRFKQVVLNLLSNAVKYNHENGKVMLSCHQLSPEYIRVQVEDNGLGIDELHQQKIFHPFVRANHTDTTTGTGIGLVITKRLIEAMGGHIGFQSSYGQGSCFWVDVPAAFGTAVESGSA